MKKKGFTLVELLAVIAILAILVIVAMPNVLGMFNQAKVNSFVTEVQKIMDTATTTFTKDALLNSGKTVYYSSESNATLGTKELDMSGNKKNYFIEMDRNGNFKRVVVYDNNYCYDIHASGTNGKLDSSKSKMIIDKINKTSVVVGDVWESGNDSVGITMNGTNYVVSGCEGVITVEGKDTNVTDSSSNVVDTELPPIGILAENCTWDEIKAISDAGRGDEYFNLGDTKTFTTSDGNTIVMQIVAFNLDIKSDGTGTAGITWISRDVIAEHTMNPTNTNNGGWESSELRMWIQNDFYLTLPLELRENIVMVQKSYYDRTTRTTLRCNDLTWIPSYREMTGNSSHETFGVEYTSFFIDESSRIKYKYSFGGKWNASWWLRSAFDGTGTTAFETVYAGGQIDGYPASASANQDIVLGFCT